MKYLLRPYTANAMGVPGDVADFVTSSPRLWRGMLIGVGLALTLVAVSHAQSSQLAQILESPSLLLLHTHAQGFLGVDVGDVDQERAQALHMKDAHGAEITVLDHDAPAGKVGLKLHDVILAVNGQGIDTADQVKEILHATAPGRKLQLLVSRDGVQQTVTVQLADRRRVQEEARERLDTAGIPSVSGNSFISDGGGDLPSSGGFHAPIFGSSLHVGAMVEPLTAQMADFLGVSGGVMVKSVAHKSAADMAGLRSHDVVLEVGGEAVVTSSDWERLIRTAEGKPVQVEILRDRMKQLVLLQVNGKRQ